MDKRNSKHITASVSGLLMMILILVSNRPAQALADPDQIGGQLVGGRATVELLAWGVDDQQIMQVVGLGAVDVAADGRFQSQVERSQGQEAASRVGLRFRGWGYRTASCQRMELRQNAVELSGGCAAGWLVRPWQQTSLNAPDGIIFYASAARSNTAPPATANRPRQVNPVRPTWAVPPASSPASSTMPTTTVAAAEPTASNQPAPPTVATAIAVETATPTSSLPATAPTGFVTVPDRATPIPPTAARPVITPTATMVPIIIERDVPLVVTMLPTSPTPERLGLGEAAPSPTVLRRRTTPTPATVAQTTPSAGFDLWPIVWWTLGGVGAFIVLAIVATVIMAARRRGRENREMNELIEDSNDQQSRADAPTLPVRQTGGGQ